MFSNFDRLDIPIKLPASHPQFLQGLDQLLELGLISDIEVKILCQNYLTCKLTLQPQMAVPQVQKATSENIIVPPVPVEALIAVEDEPKPRQKADNALARVMRSLVAELSVRWLLFLGIFLVIMSSGLLAASQWQRFPAAGQYGVLLGYTLSFFGVSFWTGKQPNLKLTTQALLIVALLLVPVNFWAIDEFSLWQNPLSWIVIVFAFLSLTTITVVIANSKLFATNFPNRNLRVLNILGLSYLHLGWKISAFPLVAIYIAMIGTSCLTLYQRVLATKRGNQQGFGLNLPTSAIVYALGLLLSRAIFINHIDITLLGLAIGICGWLVGYGNGEWSVESRELEIEGVEGVEKHSLPTSPTPYSLLPDPYLLSTLLLSIGWVVSVLPHPAQALAVTGLGLWVISQRLQRYSLKRDFAAIFLVGLQANLLIWRLVPAVFQNKIVAIASQLTDSQNESWVLWSLGLFPYLLATVVFAEYLRSSGKASLGKFGETIYLGFGTALTTIALVSPGVRSLNLLASTVTLASIYQLRLKNSSTPPHLIYLTHTTAILTFCSFINWQLPTLRPEYWATILLALMVVEWLSSLGAGILRLSAWYMGFALACISFALLWGNGYGYSYLKQGHWGAIWLVTPITLTAIASRSTNTSHKINSLSAVVALGVAQLLTLPLPRTRLVALGVAAVLMSINTGYLQQEQYAVITIGFILAFIGFAFWGGVPGLPMLSVSGWFVVTAVTILSLWVTRRYLLRKSVDEKSLPQIYAEAANKWAYVLLAGELLALTIHSVLVYQSIATSGIFYILATAITLGAILFHSWHLPSNWSFYCIGWCLELLAAQSLAFGEKTIIRVAIANIALGLATQLFGEFWRRKHRQEKLPNSFHILPIIYGAFSLVLRSQTFAAWTGLLTFSAALILISIGRRHKDLKPLTYIGLVGVSVSAYEMLFYQMLQKTGGAYGDGLIAMSALGAGIMYAYRILSPWLIRYLQLTTLEIQVVANFHWAWSSFLLLAAIVSPIGINRFVGIGTGAFLVRYAIFQGRNSITPSSPPTPHSLLPTPSYSDIWVYLGLIQAACVSIFLQNLPIGRILSQQLLPWNGAISCVVAYLLYILPWERWGWSKQPWQNVAYILPIFILWITWAHVHILAIVITAGFYAFLAKANQNFQFTYITVILIDWALFRWFGNLRLTDGLWYVAPIGLSLLYVAQFGHQIKQPEFKPSRHFLRLLGSGLICGFALIFHQDTAIIPGILSLVTIFAGLAFRIRAFLYVGTGTFLITGIYQLVIFSLRYPFLKWIVGLLVGIGLISIAANFETRREQVISLLRNTGGDFHEWE
jgi:hypothetical protein